MSNKDKILVTGASGFVGSAVARKLVEAGFSVRALVRGTSPRAHLAELDFDFFEGDLRDRNSVGRAMADMRYVFHVAADYRLWARDRSEIFASNVKGTRNLMEEAMRAGVERVIYTSSVATIALRSDGMPADETTLLREDQGIGAYKRSKIAAERLVETMVTERGLAAVIVNPSTPIGPRDVKPTPTGRIIVKAAKGRIPAFIDTGLNLVHVDDVANGHLAALHRGKIGERYILGGQNVQFSQMLGDIAALVGRRAARVRLPWRALIPVAVIAEAVANITGREPFATLDGVRMAKYRMFFSSTKAEQELGYLSVPKIPSIGFAIAGESEHDCGMFAIAFLFVRVLCDCFKSRRRLEAEVLVLRHQLNVLQQRAPRRLYLSWADRALFVWLYRGFPRILDAITILRPETIVRWHRKGFAAFWRWKSRPLGGRPQIDKEVRDLIRRMSFENPLWGAPHIHGELLKLGFDVAQPTVSKYMVPRPGRPSQTWKTFLHNHADGIASIDLFVVPTIVLDAVG